MFISFEGIDGSGKSTQLELLAQHLRSLGRDVVTVREPGGTRLGEGVRSLLLDPDSEIGPRAELLLFCAARAQAVDQVIKPALERGAIVLADRYVDSTTAYQFGARGLTFPGGPAVLHSFTTQHTFPDLVLFFDIPIDLARARRLQERDDRLEREGPDFFLRVAAAYRQLIAHDSARVVRVDASASAQALAQRVQEVVAARLPTVARDRPA